MGAFKTLSLAFLSLFLILSLFLFGATMSLGVLLQPQTYEKSFEAVGFYAFIEEQIGSEAFKAEAFLKGGVKGTVNTLLSNVLSYVRGETDKPGLVVELDQTAFSAFFEDIAGSFPFCEGGQEAFREGAPICRPPSMSLEQFIASSMERSGVKSSFDITPIVDKGDTLTKARDIAGLLKKAIYASLLAALLFTGLIFYATGKSLASALKWIGASLLLAGVTLFISSGAVTGFIGEFLPPTGDAALWSTLATELLSSVLKPLGFYGTAFAVLGAGLLASPPLKKLLKRP